MPVTNNTNYIDCTDAMEAACSDKPGDEAALIAPIMHYLWRYNRKDGAASLREAKWYLSRLITKVEARTAVTDDDDGHWITGKEFAGDIEADVKKWIRQEETRKVAWPKAHRSSKSTEEGSDMCIAFVGRKHSGKSTAANFAQDYFASMGSDAKIFSFAYPIKRMREAFLQSAGISSSDDKEEPITALPCSPTNRQLEQTIGTEWGREIISPDIWLQHMDVRLVATRHDVAIIDDVRFPNELSWCRRNGFNLIWIERPVSDVDNHKSEQALASERPCSNEPLIHNDSDIVTLRSRARHAIDTIESFHRRGITT